MCGAHNTQRPIESSADHDMRMEHTLMCHEEKFVILWEDKYMYEPQQLLPF